MSSDLYKCVCSQIRAGALWFIKILFSVQLVKDVAWLNPSITHETLLPGSSLGFRRVPLRPWAGSPHRNFPLFSSQLPRLAPANHLRDVAWRKDLQKSVLAMRASQDAK